MRRLKKKLKRRTLKMINEEEKFRAYEKARLRGLYNMLDYPRVIRYIKKYYKIALSKEEYFEIIKNYSELKERYLR